MHNEIESRSNRKCGLNTSASAAMLTVLFVVLTVGVYLLHAVLKMNVLGCKPLSFKLPHTHHTKQHTRSYIYV